MDVMTIFERLAPLHEDHEAFQKEAALVREEILSLIPDPDQRQRLRAIMWRRDIELSKYKDVTARKNVAIGMLVEDFEMLRSALNDLVDVCKQETK